MKKYYSLAISLIAALTFTACTEDEGTTPGGDSTPGVVVYKYDVASPLNPDNDVNIRVVANNAAEATYLLAEKTADKNARGLSEAEYANYVVENGTKLEAKADEQSGGVELDSTFVGLYGEYTISAVAVKGGKKTLASTTFTGLDWADVVDGVYNFANGNTQYLLGMTANATTLQVCTTDETLYRFKDVFGKGVHLKVVALPDYTATDDGGTYTYLRVPDQSIGVTYGGEDCRVRDIGYWQGDASFVTDGGYESGMYEDYYCFIMVQLHVGTTNYGYNYYDIFVPAE